MDTSEEECTKPGGDRDCEVEIDVDIERLGTWVVIIAGECEDVAGSGSVTLFLYCRLDM